MFSAYPACFIKEENGYSVIFPDLNHLATCGETLDEAFTMAFDCLAGYLHWILGDGETAPPASPIEGINLAELIDDLEISPEDAFITIITVDVEEYAKTYFGDSIKKTLTIPTWLNQAAVELDIDFSQVLQDALTELVQKS